MRYLITTFDNGNIDWNNKADILKHEASSIWHLYKEQVICNIWFSEKKDAIFIIEAESMDIAEQIVGGLPLVKANLLRYSITGLLPYTGLDRIMNTVDQ